MATNCVVSEFILSFLPIFIINNCLFIVSRPFSLINLHFLCSLMSYAFSALKRLMLIDEMLPAGSILMTHVRVSPIQRMSTNSSFHGVLLTPSYLFDTPYVSVYSFVQREA